MNTDSPTNPAVRLRLSKILSFCSLRSQKRTPKNSLGRFAAQNIAPDPTSSCNPGRPPAAPWPLGRGHGGRGESKILTEPAGSASGARKRRSGGKCPALRKSFMLSSRTVPILPCYGIHEFLRLVRQYGTVFCLSHLSPLSVIFKGEGG